MDRFDYFSIACMACVAIMSALNQNWHAAIGWALALGWALMYHSANKG